MDATRSVNRQLSQWSRAYLYGLMAGGQVGMQRAMEILTTEFTRTMQLYWVRAVWPS